MNNKELSKLINKILKVNKVSIMIYEIDKNDPSILTIEGFYLESYFKIYVRLKNDYIQLIKSDGKKNSVWKVIDFLNYNIKEAIENGAYMNNFDPKSMDINILKKIDTVNYLLGADSVDLDSLEIINDNTFNLDIHMGKETEKLNCFIKDDVIRIRMYSGYNHYIIKLSDDIALETTMISGDIKSKKLYRMKGVRLIDGLTLISSEEYSLKLEKNKR